MRNAFDKLRYTHQVITVFTIIAFKWILLVISIFKYSHQHIINTLFY